MEGLDDDLEQVVEGGEEKGVEEKGIQTRWGR